jgi:hypothetical protein
VSGITKNNFGNTKSNRRAMKNIYNNQYFDYYAQSSMMIFTLTSAPFRVCVTEIGACTPAQVAIASPTA